MFDSKDIEKSPIKELVSENYVFAAVLHYFGISFFQYEHNSLFEVCKKYKINSQQLIDELESWAKIKEPTSEELYFHPIEVLVSYLKRKHYFFVRQELPFLSNMISGIKVQDDAYSGILADLRIMFPLFVDDFIHHIHEEESRLFNRIKLLHQIEADEYRLNDALYILEKSPVTLLSEAHDAHDDEMEGIRKLTKDYFLPIDAPISMKVLYNELQVFEKELSIHAQIEDRLLFPKAIELEKEVLRKVKKQIRNN
ncbi:hemerythrin domain-containing protein [Cognataquiflexum rubidum]|uniref:hemerythrin domain-containing protein n=1 Tax=Cognataquiflexum rubidum TaxID=2922273 RepID=UPI001F1399CE|nr:hemerythrin domain-containing protein [Cognataquiflexum rubidum]MCH6235537.1 hemerythrin domain-containing protein [Cognataquiflexum rubidum]